MSKRTMHHHAIVWMFLLATASLGATVAQWRETRSAGWAALDEGNAGLARELFERALNSEGVEQGGSQAIADVLRGLALSFDQLGEIEPAERYYQRQISVQELAGDPLSTVNAIQDLAVFYDRIGRYEDELAMRARAVAILEVEYGSGIPGLSGHLTNLAGTYLRLRRPDDAEREFQRAVSVAQADLPGSESDLVWAAQRLGNFYLDTARLGEATPLYETAISVSRSSAIGVEPKLLRRYATCLRSLGRRREAVEVEKEAAKLEAHE